MGELLILAMTLSFLCRPAVAISFLAGFVRNRVTVLSQTLQLAPRVLTLPRVQAGSGGLETYLGRPIKWAVPWTSFPMHNLNYIALKLNFPKKENRKIPVLLVLPPQVPKEKLNNYY